MADILKGNYDLPVKNPDPKDVNPFEAKALEKLGGSIAFIMKDRTFKWEPPKSEPPRP